MTDKNLLLELENHDTPSITNVVATYPPNPLCLALYNPWHEDWYTDHSIRSMFPELGRRVGYAVTCVYGVADPDFDRLTLADVLDAVEASPQPAILILKQKFPPELEGKVGLSGGVMTTALKAVGCVGVVSNGPSRDMDEIRPMGMPYLLSGVTPGHGQMSVRAVNVPVSVAGMDVAPGEIVHMDENGACKFPADKIEAVLTNVRELMKQEAVLMERLQKAKTAAAIRKIMESHTFTNPNKP